MNGSSLQVADVLMGNPKDKLEVRDPQIEANRSAFTERAAWWDIKGARVLNRRCTMQEFLTEAVMDYTVAKEQATRVNLDGTVVNVPNQFHLVRSDDQRVVSPSTVTKKYETRIPRDLATVLDPIVQNGLGIYDAAFTLYEGQSEVVTVRLCDIKAKPGNDASDWLYYLIAQNYHGTGKARFKLAGSRVVCHNSVTRAFSGGADLAMVHSKSIIQKFADAPKVWAEAAAAVAKHCDRLSQLDKVVNVPETIDELLAIDDEATTQQKNRRDRIVAAACMPAMGTYGKTLYDIFNAVTYDITHNAGGKAGQTAGGRMESILDGTRGDFEETMTGKLFALAGVSI
jgi:hypothetical protein